MEDGWHDGSDHYNYVNRKSLESDKAPVVP
jgi:hypothetical protein